MGYIYCLKICQRSIKAKNIVQLPNSLKKSTKIHTGTANPAKKYSTSKEKSKLISKTSSTSSGQQQLAISIF
jgi:putative hemolysin